METHRIARAHRAAGQPIWAHRLDVSDIFHNEALTFEQRRDHIVTRLRTSAWHRDSEAVQELTGRAGPTVGTVTSSTGRGMACTTKPTTTASG